MGTDVTMPDTSVFGAILRGNQGVAQDLERLRANGDRVVVPFATYTQLKNTPNPVSRALQLTLIKELGLEVQQPTSLKQRVDVYEGYANLKTSGIATDDLAIAADVRIYQETFKVPVKLWTVERMSTNKTAIQQQFRITFSPLSRKEVLGKFVRAEDVLAMFPSLQGRFKLTSDGRIVRTFWSGRPGTAIKVGAIVVGGIALRGLLGYFAAKVYAHYAQKALDDQFKEISGRIEADLRLHREEALKLLAAGLPAFAVTTIKIWTNSDFVTAQGTTMPVVEYHGLYISPVKLNTHGTDTKFYIGNSTDIDVYITSTPITFEKDFIDAYRDYLKAIKWYEDRISSTDLLAERVRLDRELMGMIGEMKEIIKRQ
jgi:hypothetical protein